MCDGRFSRGWRWSEVEDPVAARTLNDLIVAADFLKHLRAQANMARGAETIAGGDSNRETLARAGDLLEQRNESGLERLDERLPLFSRILQCRFDRGEFL